MKTVNEVLTGGTQYLEARGIEGARHSMQSLMVHVLGCDRTWLYLHYGDPLPEAQLAPLRELLRRRGQGEPLQHLLGSTEFYRREFRTDSRALIPRPETEELVELALARTERREGMRVLDMGCGSGVIGITLALELAAQQPAVVMADISAAALALTLENANRLGARVQTYRSDLFSAWADTAESAISPPDSFDLVLANLPYVPDGEQVAAEVAHDPATALYGGPDGLDVVRAFLKESLPHLAGRALVALEVGHDQGERVRALMQELGFTDTEVLTDMSGKPRFPIGRAPEREEKAEGISQEVIDAISGMEGIRVDYTPAKKSKLEWIEDAREYFLEHYAGRRMSIGQTGYILHVPESRTKARRVTFNIDTQKQNVAFKQLEEVIDNAIHLASRRAVDKAGQSERIASIVANTATFETFGAKVVINDKNNLVWFNGQTKEEGAMDVLLYEFGSRQI